MRGLASAGYRLTRLSQRLTPSPAHRAPEQTLAGDRDVEWAWSLAHLRPEPGRVLDLGAGTGMLSLAAVFRGHDVVAVDLEEQAFLFLDPRVDYRRGDFNAMTFEPRSFDQVLNCSTIEHFGLGGRYGSHSDPEADVVAMRRLHDLLRPDGTMVLTIPVGLDAVVAPLHRIYGRERLPQLLEPFRIVLESYRAKRDSNRWEEIAREDALRVSGSAKYYGLGLFVLAPA